MLLRQDDSHEGRRCRASTVTTSERLRDKQIRTEGAHVSPGAESPGRGCLPVRGRRKYEYLADAAQARRVLTRRAMKTNARFLFAILVSLSFSLPAAASPADGSCVTVDASALEPVAVAVAGAFALTSAPSPERFANAWTREFAGAVRSAAGTDGRLSLNEARTLAERSVYGDNTVNWLEKKDQQSVDIDKLIKAGWNYAFANGKRVAGDDGRISLEDAKALPGDLQNDYLDLRGRLDGGVSPTPDVEADLVAAAEGITVISETDWPLDAVIGESDATGAITPDEVRAVLGARHDELLRINGYMPLAERHPEIRDFGEWIGDDLVPYDADDADAVAEAARWNKVYDTLKSKLTDLTVIRFNERPDSDAITSSVFIVGRTVDGRLAGYLTHVVET